MKLTFKSRKFVPIEKDILYEMVSSFLIKNSYKTNKISESLLLFDDSNFGWKWIPFSNAYSHINKGDFEFIEKGNETEILLTFQLTILPEILMISLIIFTSTYMGYRVLFFCLLFILDYFYKVWNIRTNFIRNIVK
jgi:hypothetical protein